MITETIFCQCGRKHRTDSEFCFYCDPSVSDEEKQKARSRGGRNSRKVHPYAIGEIPKEINTRAERKALLISGLGWMLEGLITSAVYRAICVGSEALRKEDEFELFELLSKRVEQLENQRLLVDGEKWDIQ